MTDDPNKRVNPDPHPSSGQHDQGIEDVQRKGPSPHNTDEVEQEELEQEERSRQRQAS